MCDIDAVSRPDRDGRAVADVPMLDGIGPVALADLEEALAANRIQAHYQPIVRIADRVPAAVEVLARLAHPARGMVLPDLFVPQLEEAGLARKLTASVAESAFAEWEAGHLVSSGMALALNFPLDVLLTPAALTALDRQRTQAGIPAGHVIVELTESRPVTRLGKLGAAVARLRRAGYCVAIDDVGPGQRDARDLLALDFSMLKLDKGFVQDAMRCPGAAESLDRTLAGARAAGMRVVAEGVANAECWAHVAALGIDFAQGYHVARPMSAACVREWHRAWTGEPLRAASA